MKASFSIQQWIGYDGVPIPDHIKTKEAIFDYLLEHLGDFDKYRDKNDNIFGSTDIYQVILEDENSDETIIIHIDD